MPLVLALRKQRDADLSVRGHPGYGQRKILNMEQRSYTEGQGAGGRKEIKKLKSKECGSLKLSNKLIRIRFYRSEIRLYS